MPGETKRTDEKAMFSIVIPVYNERENIETVFQRVTGALDPMNRPYEIIFIDDGSADGSTDILKKLPGRHPAVRTVILTRNYGQHSAVAAGFDVACGEFIIAMDADLQVDPADLPRMVRKMDEGYDIVAGYREHRKEAFLTRRLPSRLINAFFRKFLRLPYRDMGCGMQAFRRSAIQGIDPHSALYKHRAIYAVWNGGSFADIPVNYQERQSGDSKYHLADLVYLTLDMVITFLTHPIQLVVFFLLGSILAISGLGGAALLGISAVTGVNPSPALWALSLFSLLTGILFMTFGFVNERLNRINHSLNAAPCYVIREIIGADDSHAIEDDEHDEKTT